MDQNLHQIEVGSVKPNTGTVAVDDAQSIDLLHLLNVVRRHILIIIAVALVFAIGAGIYTELTYVPIYSSTTSTYMASSRSGVDELLQSADLSFSRDIIGDYSNIIKSRTLLEDVIEMMDLPYSYGTLSNMISVTNPAGTHIIKITVADTDPYRARDIANTLTDYAVERLSEIMGINVPSVYDKAIVATNPSGSGLTKNVMVAFVAGAVLAAGIIVLIDMMDTTVKTAEDIEGRCGMVTLTKVYNEGGKKKRSAYSYAYSDTDSSKSAGNGKKSGR